MRRFSLALAAATYFLAVLSADAITLVRDRAPAATIVVADEVLTAEDYTPAVGRTPESLQKVKLAATEFQRYVEKMSGAKLPIVGASTATTGPVVLIGASPRTAAVKPAIPAGLTADRREEGFVLQAKGDTLVLAGNDEGPYQGTFFAVSEMLNRLGVRWFMPSEFGECVPELPTITVDDVDVLERPSFIVRSWNGNLAHELRSDDAMFRLRNKLTLDHSAILAIPGDSYLRKYMPPKEMMETHPEYFATRLDGRLDPHMVSMTNPDVVLYVAEKVKAEIAKKREKDPTFNSLGFAPDDGIPMDLSKEAQKRSLGFTDLVGRDGVIQERSISEEWFTFMNGVAAEVTKTYPDFIITTNGYTNRTFPPEGVALHPNMGVMFAAIWSDLLHSFDDPKSWQQNVQGALIKRWGELCPRVFIYNYNFPMLVNCLTPMPLTRKIARNTPLIKSWGIAGFEDEQTFSWMAHGITSFYLRSKLYWNADADSAAILDDYYTTWYGPAAVPAKASLEALEEALESTQLLGHEDRILPYVYTDAMLATMETHTAAAEALATREPYKTRVRIDRLILDHMKGYVAMNRAEFVGDYAEAIRQADGMFAARAELNAISAFFYFPESKDPRLKYFAGSHYWNLTARKAFYEKMQARLGGDLGTLVAKATREVPFSLDKADLGRYFRWFEPDFDRSAWRTIDTTTPFYLQGDGMLEEGGLPYVGYMWYVFELDVPESAIGKPIQLYAPMVATEAWVWTNGAYSGHRDYQEAYIRPAQLDMDVTKQVHAGRNVIGVRVSTSASRIQVAEGFQGPLYLYSPKPEAAAAAKP